MYYHSMLLFMDVGGLKEFLWLNTDSFVFLYKNGLLDSKGCRLRGQVDTNYTRIPRTEYQIHWIPTLTASFNVAQLLCDLVPSL